MKTCSSILLTVFSLLVLSAWVWAAEEESHSEGEGGGESTSICSGPLNTLQKAILEIWDHNEYNVIINCLAFGQERELELGVASVFSLSGTTEVRYRIECRSNVLVALETNQSASGINITQNACLECRADAEDPDDICHDRCDGMCERCYGSPGQCTECAGYRLLNSYPPRNPELTAEIIEREGEVEMCTDNPEGLESFTCVESCPDDGNHFMPNEKDRTCFACGLEYCVACEPEKGEHGECTTCLSRTVHFEGECFACDEALIAREAIVQEAEEQEEEREKELRQIELAVSLPIVCVLVIVAFVLVSIYAHHRYPHISHRGHKRHRKKPVVLEESSPPPTGESEVEDDRPALVESAVWRARPTIRFR